MAMFAAYFDASGHPDAKGGAMFVSGFVSTVDDWLRFEEEWLALLTEYGIANPFHMAEFIACSEQFVDWKGDERRQLEFYGRALKVIQYRSNKALSQGVMLNDWRKVLGAYVIPEDYSAAKSLKAPIAWCGVGALIQLARWADRRRKSGRKVSGEIQVVFDRGDKDRGLLADAVRELFNVELIFKDKKDVVPIQAADILAWEHARVCGVLEHGNVGKLRVSSWPDIRRLFPGSDEWAYMDAQKLASLFEEQGLRKRNAR